MTATKHTVFAWCNSGNGTDWQVWIAIAEDGHVFAQHVSSSHAWGMRDVGPDGFYRDKYVEKFGERFMDNLDYVVMPPGKSPPREVYERNQAMKRAAEVSA